MAAAYVEHRPKSADMGAKTTHHVIIVNGKDLSPIYKTQKQPKEKACDDGCRPVHVARERHLQDRDTPAHWREDSCD